MKRLLVLVTIALVALAGMASGNSGTRVGQNSGTGGLEWLPLTGMIDDVKIWARALTSDEIRDITD